LLNTVRAASQLAKPVNVPKDRLTEVVADMRKARYTLHRLIKALSEEIGE